MPLRNKETTIKTAEHPVNASAAVWSEKFKALPFHNWFIFSKVMENPDIFKAVVKASVPELYLDSIDFVIERGISPEGTVLGHGFRTDTDGNPVKNVIDVEMQAAGIGNPALRIRRYGSVIDRTSPERYSDYSQRPQRIVIVFCTYDPFGKNRLVYSFRPQCQECSQLYLEDGTLSVVINCTASAGNEKKYKDLSALASYIMTQNDSFSNAFIHDINRAVIEVKNSFRYMHEFMTFEERLTPEEKQGMEKGRSIEKINTILSTVGKLKRKNMSEEDAFSLLDYADEDIQLYYDASGWLNSHEGISVEDYVDQVIMADTEWDDSHRA